MTSIGRVCFQCHIIMCCHSSTRRMEQPNTTIGLDDSGRAVRKRPSARGQAKAGMAQSFMH
eukprot:4730608-Amphidinium_carterae.1